MARVGILLLLVVCLHLIVSSNAIICPDGKMECKVTNTCCLLPGEKRYGCCPFIDGICCADHIHCCPKGSTCDQVRKQCSTAPSRVTSNNPLLMMLSRVLPGYPADSPMVSIITEETVSVSEVEHMKVAASVSEVEPMKVAASVPEEETMMEAAIASEEETMMEAAIVSEVEPMKKAAMLSSETKYYPAVEAALTNGTLMVMGPCPDRSVCPGDYTCCPFYSGGYGCCPFTQGVCCSDKLSCCPHATTCLPNHTCQANHH